METLTKGGSIRLIRLKQLRAFTDKWGDWVICQDLNKKQWTVPKVVFDQFKYLGLPVLDPEMEAQFHALLGGQHYPDLPKTQRYSLIKTLLETCTKAPIEYLFPNI